MAGAGAGGGLEVEGGSEDDVAAHHLGRRQELVPQLPVANHLRDKRRPLHELTLRETSAGPLDPHTLRETSPLTAPTLHAAPRCQSPAHPPNPPPNASRPLPSPGPCRPVVSESPYAPPPLPPPPSFGPRRRRPRTIGHGIRRKSRARRDASAATKGSRRHPRGGRLCLGRDVGAAVARHLGWRGTAAGGQGAGRGTLHMAWRERTSSSRRRMQRMTEPSNTLAFFIRSANLLPRHHSTTSSISPICGVTARHG